MTVLIIIFGALTFFAGLVIAVHPASILGFLRRQLGKVELHVLNVAIRVVFGISMISQANLSKFSLVIEIIGWFCIGIAVILTLLRRERFNRVIAWAVSLVEIYSYVAGVLIMMFGAFLIYAFV